MHRDGAHRLGDRAVVPVAREEFAVLQLARLSRPNFEAARPAGRVDKVHDAEEVLVVELRDGVALGAEVVEDEDDVARRHRSIVHSVRRGLVL